jgi:hypothetical protein
MSRAGKFIPGGSNKAKRTGPIRAPEGPQPGGGTGPLPSPDGKKRLLSKTGFNKKIDKSQKWPITIMSGITCAALVSTFGYFLWIVPLKHQKEEAEAAAAKAAADYQAEIQKEHDDEIKRQQELAAQKGVLTLDTNPSGAMITVGDSQMHAPAKFADLIPGKNPDGRLRGLQDRRDHLSRQTRGPWHGQS